MSRNLVKQIYTVIQPDEKRVIDTNELLQRRLKEIAVRQRAGSGDFASGLVTEGAELHAAECDQGIDNVIEAQDDAGMILTRAQEEAESILAEAKAEAMRVREEAKKQAEVEKNRILADAKQHGYSEGIAQARAEAKKETDAAKKEYQKKERQLEDFYQQQVDELEPQLVGAITDIYQHIFHVELESYREILAHLISDTLRKIDGAHDFMIHVSKEDYPHVSMQKKQILAGAVSANCNVEIVEDMTLAKNECLIETENGIFDCGLGTQLAELKQKLMLLSWSREV